MIGTGIFCGSLYRLELFVLLYVSTTLTVNTASGSKCLRLNEKSSTLWHKRFSHISRQRIERLIKDEILLDLDFSDFDTCVDCIKGKLISKVRNAKIDKCTELLVLFIHIFVDHSFLLL